MTLLEQQEVVHTGVRVVFEGIGLDDALENKWDELRRRGQKREVKQMRTFVEVPKGKDQGDQSRVRMFEVGATEIEGGV